MVKYNKRRNTKNEELVSDPHELLLSLVDLGSIDCEDALLACVTEMSDAECKRVLSSLSLPDCCDDAEDEDDLVDEEPDDLDDDLDDELNPVADEIVDVEDSDDSDVDDEDLSQEESRCRDLESRIKQLERKIRSESFRRVSRRFK